MNEVSPYGFDPLPRPLQMQRKRSAERLLARLGEFPAGVPEIDLINAHDPYVGPAIFDLIAAFKAERYLHPFNKDRNNYPLVYIRAIPPDESGA